MVKEGSLLKVEKVEGEVGSKLNFGEVLAIGDENNLKVGTPLIKGAKVSAEIMEQGKGKKVVIIKHKAKKRYKKKQGHRQLFTKVKITKIA